MSRTILNKFCKKIDLDVCGLASSASVALQKLDNLENENSIIPDLILCDIHMEGMDGYDFVNKIKSMEKYSSTKLIAVTFDLRAKLTKDKKIKEFDGLLTKPVTIENLIQVIVPIISDSKKKWESSKDSDQNLGSCGGIKILVVEDIEVNQLLIKAYFDEFGCKGDYASDGRRSHRKVGVKQL